ncbi:MAG: 50S ribosomal protein L29 [Metamycoplasmataceae bacterium]
MQYSELIKKTKEELENLLNDYRAELFTLRFKNKTGQLDACHKIKDIRKDIAKTLTAIKEIELGDQIRKLQPKNKNKETTKKDKGAK